MGGPQRICEGFPKGHLCPVLVPADRHWCHSCLALRQAALASGIGESHMVRVGIVVEDFNAPILACACGGDPTSPHHACSLLHLQWSWSQKQLGIRR